MRLGLDKTAELQRKVLKDDEDSSELTLKCHVEGNPEPSVIWTRNKQRCGTLWYIVIVENWLYFEVYIYYMTKQNYE